MAELLDVVTSTLEDKGLRLDVTSADEATYVIAEPAEDPGPWPLLVVVDDADRRVLVYSVAPLDVPPRARPEVAELLTRANWGLLDGNFELDLGDGEVRFKTSLPVGSRGLEPEVFETIVATNIRAMETYVDAIADVADGSTSAVDAIDAVEG